MTLICETWSVLLTSNPQEDCPEITEQNPKFPTLLSGIEIVGHLLPSLTSDTSIVIVKQIENSFCRKKIY